MGAGHRGFKSYHPDQYSPLEWRYHRRNSPISVHSIGRDFWLTHQIDIEAGIERLNAAYLRTGRSLLLPTGVGVVGGVLQD